MRLRLPWIVASFALVGCYARAEGGVHAHAGTVVYAVPDAEPIDEDAGAIAYFEPALSPYGAFVEDPMWGTVWVPDAAIVGPGFQPYLTSGHWAYTDEGYYWVSDFDWGWAPFHYGRWVWSSTYGWVWIAGRRYAPAWVEWRSGGGYIGWGPMPPRWCWRHGAVVYLERPVSPPYVFVASGSFFAPHPHLVIVDHEHAPAVMAGTTRWVAPARPIVGARPFVGPDPHASGIPVPARPTPQTPIAPPPVLTPAPKVTTPPPVMTPAPKVAPPPVIAPPIVKPKPPMPGPIKPKIPPKM